MKRAVVSLAGVMLVLLGWANALKAETYEFKEGTDFTVLPKPITVPGVKAPYILEYMWLGCSHCQALNPLIADYERSHPSVNVVRRPGLGNDRWVFDAHVFYALEETGHGKLIYELMNFYQQLAAAEHRLPDQQDLLPFLQQHKIDPTGFTKAMDSDATLEKLSISLKDQQQLGIKAVPVLLVAGKYQVQFAGMKGVKDQSARLSALFDYLLIEAAKH